MSAVATRRSEHLVIVGAGHAGVQAAHSLREAGHTGSVTLLSDEAYAPYDRPPLSKSVLTATDTGSAAVALRAASSYGKRDIDLRQRCRVSRIDLTRNEVVLSTQERKPFDHLILATGSRARELRVPGAELPGIVQIRTLADALALRPVLHSECLQVVIVGGGFIGLELAAASITLGHDVTIVEGLDRLLSRSVAPEISQCVAAAHRSRGCVVELETSVVRFNEYDGRVCGVELSTGSILPADVVIVGVGGVPNSELATQAGLDTCPVTGGVLVDEVLRSSDPRVSAIGDCATFPSLFAGGPARLESVQNATDQARHVAARLVGAGDGPYVKVPWFWTDQYDMKIQIAGIATNNDQRSTLGDPASGSFSVLRFASGVLAAVDSINRPADHIAARKILDSSRRPTLAETLRSDFELRTFFAATQ